MLGSRSPTNLAEGLVLAFTHVDLQPAAKRMTASGPSSSFDYFVRFDAVDVTKPVRKALING